jgi:hypothetical protein
MTIALRGTVVARRDAGHATHLTLDVEGRTRRVLVADENRGLFAPWRARPEAGVGARVEVVGEERLYDGKTPVLFTTSVRLLHGDE